MNSLSPGTDSSIERLLFLRFLIKLFASDAGSRFKAEIQEVIEVETSAFARKIGIISRGYQTDSFSCASVLITRSARKDMSTETLGDLCATYWVPC